MDLVLEAADRHLLTPYVYPAGWPEDEPCRQLLSLFVITNLGALALYLLFGTLSYYFIFDHELKKHPHFLEVGAPQGLLTLLSTPNVTCQCCGPGCPHCHSHPSQPAVALDHP